MGMLLEPLSIGVIGIATIMLLIAIKVPIGLALGLVATCGMAAIIGWHATLSLIGLITFESAASWELSAIPMFLLMGAIAYNSGLTNALFDAARVWLGGLPGGLAVATNFACAGFAAASGSSLATTVAMGRIAIPEMRAQGYDTGLATGVVASAGTLGSLIPPSVLMILIGVFSETSIIDLFLAGIVPGLLTACAFAALIVIRVRLNPSLAPFGQARASRQQKWAALMDVWPLPALIVAILGGLYGGIVTATEAGAFGSVLATIIAYTRGQLTIAVIRDSIVDALAGTAAIFFVVIGAVLLTRFMAFSGLPLYLSDLMLGAGTSPILIVLMAAAVYLVLGMFLDPLGLLLLTLPVMLPVFKAANLDMIWIGILIVKFVEIGLMTPPVGLNVYAVKTLVGFDISIETIFRGVMWFLLADVAVTGILIAFPQIVVFLPRMLQN